MRYKTRTYVFAVFGKGLALNGAGVVELAAFAPLLGCG